MKLKVPPAVVLLIALLGMWGLQKIFYRQFSCMYQAEVFWILFGIGVIIISIAVITFIRLKTTVDPLKPDAASTLAIIGIYKITRNPMYLGMLCILVAAFLKFGVYPNLLILFTFIWYMNINQIKPEEERLEKLFGNQYKAYRLKVRRWL